MKVPTIMQARILLEEAEKLNPGVWVEHNKVSGVCAKAIAEKCDNLDSDVAYVLGLLHDIGRRYGVCDMKHILNGYSFMTEQGFIDSARICLTHSFPYKNIGAYNGENDCNTEESVFIQKFLDNTVYNDYDKLIQLCDAIAFPTGVTYVEKRLVDIVLRKGFNDLTVPKWQEFLKLKEYFDKKTSCDLYKLLEI